MTKEWRNYWVVEGYDEKLNSFTKRLYTGSQSGSRAYYQDCTDRRERCIALLEMKCTISKILVKP
jgi:hypothetical protein